jgi:hypothetical protein
MSTIAKNGGSLFRRLWNEVVVWGSFALFVVVEIEVMYIVYRCLGVW